MESTTEKGATVVVAMEHRFVRVGGRIYTTMYTHDKTWKRYLQVFEKVVVLARVEEKETLAASFVSAEGPGVEFLAVPGFIGPLEFLKRRAAVARTVAHATNIGDAFVLRVPGTVGTMLWRRLRKLRRPYGVEVVGDPLDALAPGAVRSPFRPVARHMFAKFLKEQCAGASVAAYVTARKLQERYPPGGWSTNYSSVRIVESDLADESLLKKRRIELFVPRTNDNPWRLINIGTMAQMYKRQDLLLQAVARLRAQGLPIALTLVGDGQFRSSLEEEARRLGIEKFVTFTGLVPAGAPLHAQLDRADLFVLSSRQEGLARVVLEAMARGLPVISTQVGGMDEVVDLPQLVPPDDVDALVRAISDLLRQPEKMARLVDVNRRKMDEYQENVLLCRVREFCSRLRAASISGGGHAP